VGVNRSVFDASQHGASKPSKQAAVHPYIPRRPAPTQRRQCRRIAQRFAL